MKKWKKATLLMATLGTVLTPWQALYAADVKGDVNLFPNELAREYINLSGFRPSEVQFSKLNGQTLRLYNAQTNELVQTVVSNIIPNSSQNFVFKDVPDGQYYIVLDNSKESGVRNRIDILKYMGAIKDNEQDYRSQTFTVEGNTVKAANGRTLQQIKYRVVNHPVSVIYRTNRGEFGKYQDGSSAKTVQLARGGSGAIQANGNLYNVLYGPLEGDRYGATTTLQAIPSPVLTEDEQRAGIRFVGWHPAESMLTDYPDLAGRQYLTNAQVQALIVQGDLDFTAVFAIPKYNLTFKTDQDKGSIEGDVSLVRQVGALESLAAADIPAAEPKEGYKFVGWFEDLTTNPVSTETITAPVYSDRTYYAKYEPVVGKSYQVTATYKSEDGTVLADPSEKDYVAGQAYQTRQKMVPDNVSLSQEGDKTILTITKWALKEQPANATGTIVDQDVLVEYVYKATTQKVVVPKEVENIINHKVVATYTSDTGAVLSNKVSALYGEGEAYETEAKLIPDSLDIAKVGDNTVLTVTKWVLTKTPENATGTMGKEDLEVSYVYSPQVQTLEIPKEQLSGMTTVWVDTNGTALRDPKQGLEPHGDVSGYGYISTVIDGTVIKHVFNQTHLTTQWLDKAGNLLKPTQVGTFEHGEIPGYVFKETKVDEAGNQTHIFVKISEITTEDGIPGSGISQTGGPSQSTGVGQGLSGLLPETGLNNPMLVTFLGLGVLAVANVLYYVIKNKKEAKAK